MKKCILMLIMACHCPIVAQAQLTTAKIGSVDVNYIVSRLPETKAGEAELASLQQQYRKQLDVKVRAFQVKLESIRHARFTDSTQRVAEQELRQMQADIERAEQEALAALEQKTSVITTTILAKVQQAIVTVSHAGGFNLMLQAENILYGDAAVDMTLPVLAALGVVLPEADKQQYQGSRNNLESKRINKQPVPVRP
jgi:outer membrane protein